MRWHDRRGPAKRAREQPLATSLDPQVRETPGAATGASKPRPPSSARSHRSGRHDFAFRPPEPGDAAEVWRIARDSGALDLNSPYFYLILCSDFADTCLVAERRGALVGFLAAYRPPARKDVVFVWQIAVAAEARGSGLATELLTTLLERPGVRDVRQLEASVTPGNRASRRLFEGFARRRGAACREAPLYGAELFPAEAGSHEPEILLRIGPLERAEPRIDSRTTRGG